MAGSFLKGADVAACMFAIHYFFENNATLNGLLKNLDDTVKVGGTFVGCCFDGAKVFNLLRDVKKGHSKTGKEGDVPIWSITKEYDNDELLLDDSSIGLPIDVEFISIGSTHKEYLVLFELLVEKLATIGFRLLNDAELTEMNLTGSTNTFDVTYATAEKGDRFKKFIMPDSVKEFSFLNRWFIFKRQGLTAAIAPTAAIAATAPTAAVVINAAAAEEPVIVPEAAMTRSKPNTGIRVLPPLDQKFAAGDIVRFGMDVPLVDSLRIKDINAGRWMGLAAPFLTPTGIFLAPKGNNAEAELTAAAQQWHMQVARISSTTNPAATILQITEVSRVGHSH